VAFLDREEMLESIPPAPANDTPLSAQEQAILDLLRQRGASFVVDLAHAGNLPPSVVRDSLWSLLGRSLVTNDHFDVVRRGRAGAGEAAAPSGRPARLSLTSLKRRGGQRPGGRWSP